MKKKPTSKRVSKFIQSLSRDPVDAMAKNYARMAKRSALWSELK